MELRVIAIDIPKDRFAKEHDLAMTIEHVSMVEHVLESQHVMRLNQLVAKD